MLARTSRFILLAACLPAATYCALPFVCKKGISDLLHILLQVSNHYNKWNGLFSRSDTASSPSGAPPSKQQQQKATLAATSTAVVAAAPAAVSARAAAMATAEAHNEEGRQAFQAGNYAKASQCYEAAIAAGPSNAKYHTNLANVLLKLT